MMNHSRILPRAIKKYMGHRRTIEKARTFKQELKADGFRVSIKANITGGYDIYAKDIRRIDEENNRNFRRKNR